jgi:hypothetical protein
MNTPEINANYLSNVLKNHRNYLPAMPPLQEQFKTCLQQYLLGLNITPLLTNEPWLCQGMNQLRTIAPELFKYPEAAHGGFPLSLSWYNHLLSSQFDALIIAEDTIHLFDCILPPYDFELSQIKQQLDCFLMSKTSSYFPEQITYSSCLIGEAQPVIITSHYNRKQHKLFEQQLSQWLKVDLVKPQNDWRKGNGLTAQLLRQEISVEDYLDAIPEVAI